MAWESRTVMSILADSLINVNAGDNPEIVHYTQRILDHSNYILGSEAELIHNRLTHQARQKLGHNRYHDWLVTLAPRGGRNYYRGRINENGEWIGNRLNYKKKPVNPTLSGSDIRAKAKESGIGVFHIPRAPFELPNADKCDSTNIVETEWDSTDPDPRNWHGVKVLSLFNQYGIRPNSITSSGGKCDGLSPHAEWFFSKSLQTIELLYLQYILECFGADPATTRSSMQQYRKPGFFRFEKGREQGLFCDYHETFYDVLEWIETALKIGKSLGIDILTPDQWHKKRAEEAERNTNDNPIDITLFDGDDIARLISEIDSQLPPYSKGGGTYPYRLKILTAFAVLVGSKSTAMALAPNLTNGASFGNLSGNSSPFGTIVNQTRLFLGDPEWQLSQWFGHKYRDELSQKKRIKQPDGYGSPLQDAEIVSGNIYQWMMGKFGQRFALHDIRSTGSGKTRGAVLEFPTVFKAEFPKGRVIILTNDPRNFPIQCDFDVLPPRNDYGFTKVNGRVVRADIDTPTENLIDLGGHCPYTSQFQALADKGTDPYMGGSPLPCINCEHSDKCSTTDSWFRKGRNRVLSSGKSFISHPDSLIDTDLSDIPTAVFIDESSKALNIYRDLKFTLEDAKAEMDGISQAMIGASNAPYFNELEPDKRIDPEEFFKPVRAILRSLETVSNSVEANKTPYGIEHTDILDKLPAIPDNLSAIISEIKQYKESFSKELLDLKQSKKKGKKSSVIDTINKNEAVNKMLEKRPLRCLVALLESLQGNGYIHLSKGQFTVKVADFNRYDYLKTAYGVVFMDATENKKDLESKMRELNRPIITFRHESDNPKPYANLTLTVTEIEGLTGIHETSEKAKYRDKALINEFSARHPDLKPVIFGKKADREWLALDAHWGAGTRGSNDFMGQQLIIVSGLLLPNLTAYRGEYFCLYGNLDGFTEWYVRKVNEEVMQMTGRPRCHRYPDSQFFIYLISPMEREIRNYSYLTELGATVIEAKAETVTADAGDKSFQAKKQYEQAILSLDEKGDKITVSSVATAAGVSQPALSKFIKNGSIVFSEWVSEVLTAAGRTIESTVLSVQNEKVNFHNPPFSNLSKGMVMESQFSTTNCTDLDSVSEDDDVPFPGPIPTDWEKLKIYNRKQLTLLGWTKEQARDFARSVTKGKDNRNDMTDLQLITVTQELNKLCAEKRKQLENAG